MHPTVDMFFEDISRSTLNQHLEFDLFAGNDLLNRINCLDRESRAHKSLEMNIGGLDFFILISRFMMIQRLKFVTIALFGLPNMFNHSDHNSGAYKIK